MFKVKTHSVEVTWTCKGFTQSGAGTDQLKSPPDCIVGDNLKWFVNFVHYLGTMISSKVTNK